MTSKFFTLPGQIFLAISAGILVGHFGGEKFGFVDEFSKLIIMLIKAGAIPLLFFVILYSIVTTEINKKDGLKLISITGINGFCALLIGIGVAYYFQAGVLMKDSLKNLPASKETANLKKYAGQKVDFLENFKSYFPDSFFKPFTDNNTISLILIAIFFGFVIRSIHKNSQNSDKEWIAKLVECIHMFQKIFEKALIWLVYLIPIAVFCAVCKTIGSYGFGIIYGLILYLGVAVLGLALHIIFVYHGWLLVKRLSIKEFWKKAWNAVVYSFGCNSSLATLPLTLKTLDELKVSKKCATLGACIGTNLNNDGILLYEGMAVYFAAQYYGVDFTVQQHFFIALVCVAGTIGIAGIPEAGFITLSIVLTTIGLPVEILPILLTVDWIIARLRSVTNVLGDMIVSIALDAKRST